LKSWLTHAGALALVPLAFSGPLADAADRLPIYAALHGELLLDNSRVLVERFVLPPGQSTGRHTHPGDQLLVFVKGGVLKSAATARATLWRDGRVVWQNSSDPADAGSENVGTEPLVMIWVTLKPAVTVAPPVSAAAGDRQDAHLNYPNIPGEDLLENDRVIVQRFVVNPGQWEGVHAHRPNMLYIHIKGGQWAARSRKEPEHPYPAPSPDGKVGWMPAIDISEGHESGNVGNQPIDLIWVTLKD
jgi:predicted metal-dependent enzyme (double-stranded beta helix superfamily)